MKTQDVEKVDALTCPERDQHKTRLNQVCGRCGEIIPGGGAYTPAVFDRFFRMGPDQAEPPHQHPFSEAEAAGWREYEQLNEQYTAAAFFVEDLRRDRAQISGRYVDRSGNTQTDTSVHQRAGRIDEQIAVAIAQREKLREQAQQKLLEIGQLSRARTAKIVADLYAESYPPPAPTLLERAASALKGERA